MRSSRRNCRRYAREILLDKSDYDDIKATSLTALTQFGDDEAFGKDKALLKSVDRLSAGKASTKVQAKRAPVPQQVRPVKAAIDADAPQRRARCRSREFAALVDAIAADPDRREQLTELLREDHPLYDERGAATIVRMRGWVLLAMARAGVSDAALIFVLEELDTGVDPYLVAAAARALRSYPRPNAALAPFVMRALANIRYRDEPVSFENYGEYAGLVYRHEPRSRTARDTGMARSACARRSA